MSQNQWKTDFTQGRTVDQFSSQHKVAANKVLRNTYLMLSMTLLFSAITAGISMSINAPLLSPIITLIVYFGLFFAVNQRPILTP